VGFHDLPKAMATIAEVPEKGAQVPKCTRTIANQRRSRARACGASGPYGAQGRDAGLEASGDPEAHVSRL